MKAAILENHHAPLAIRELSVPPPGIGRVHVRITKAGICGAQLQEIRGEKAADMPLPRILGHEGCGIVLDVGEGVRHVEAGDRVVLHWRMGQGMDGGGVIYGNVAAGPLHTFCTEAVISANRCTAIPEEVSDDLACLLGCALSTALGVLENDAKLRAGESLLVVGCGGVGLSIIQAARMLGAWAVEGIDKSESSRNRARIAGTTDIIPDHFDCIIDTTGDKGAISDALALLAPGGRFVLVGQPPPGGYIGIPNARRLFDGSGATIIASQGGGFVPQCDIPRYANLARAGLLKPTGITHRISLEEINHGIAAMQRGEAGRVIIEMP